MLWGHKCKPWHAHTVQCDCVWFWHEGFWWESGNWWWKGDENLHILQWFHFKEEPGNCFSLQTPSFCKKPPNVSCSGVLYRWIVAGFCLCEDACVVVSVRSDKGDFITCQWSVIEEITKLLNIDIGNDGIYHRACWIWGCCQCLSINTKTKGEKKKKLKVKFRLRRYVGFTSIHNITI